MVFYLPEPFVVAVVYHPHPVARDIQFCYDILIFIIGHSDNPATFVEYSRYDKTSIQPSHILIHRLVVLVAWLKEDDVVQGEN